jgi:hypothetical protein
MSSRSAAIFFLGSAFGLLLSSLSSWNQHYYRFDSFDESQLDKAMSRFEPSSLAVEELLTSPLFCKNEARSAFDKIADEAYQHMFHGLPNLPRQPFDLKSWRKATEGGLHPEDRILLAQIYGQANSVFEYGLGESTYIADHVGVKRYAGIDSDPNWIALARSKVSSSYRFYLADIGTIRGWGMPNQVLSKQPFTYQLAPLIVEPVPFDVYMVDGRFRFPCVLASFLHAAARGADSNSSTVLLHDCYRDASKHVKTNRSNYHAADHLLDMVNHSGGKLCVYKRKPETTDEQLMAMWSSQKLDVY